MNHRNSVSRTKTQGLQVKTNVKAGLIIVVCRSDNHNQTLVREAKSLRVKTNLKAGLKLKY